MVRRPTYTIYCDKREDVDFARRVFTDGPLASATLMLLPARGHGPECLQPYQSWERADWIVVRDDEIVAIAEVTEHGYTGDNGFQRFARPQRAAMLGIPFVYFTPFSRTRLNEMEDGQFNARNVAPEMFQALLTAGNRYDVPCLALRWPTDAQGQPVILHRSNPYVDQLKALLECFATRSLDESGWSCVPQNVIDEMDAQAAIAFRTTETRGTVRLPIDVEDDKWIWDCVPETYYRSGKAEKIYAYSAMASAVQRPLPRTAPPQGFWTKPGRAQYLYLGYQWRPDPATGLIAFAGAIAEAANMPLIVIWPRVFLQDSLTRQRLLRAWDDLRQGSGDFVAEGRQLGFSDERIEALGARANLRERQFGVFTPLSKVGRVMAEVADLVVFGDGLYLPR